VLVLEKHAEIGPKTCAGGLTTKAMRELELLGLSRDLTLRLVGHIGFAAYPAPPPDSMAPSVTSLAPSAIRAGWDRMRPARREVRPGAPATASISGRTAPPAAEPIPVAPSDRRRRGGPPFAGRSACPPRASTCGRVQRPRAPPRAAADRV
jgi:hypothetical protein